MAQIVMMPKEGITVESCLVGAWQKELGDSVNVDEVLFEYETDKAAFECVSTVAGVLLYRFFEQGDEAPVLTPAAIIGEAGEDIGALIASADEGAGGAAADDGSGWAAEARGETLAAASDADTGAVLAAPAKTITTGSTGAAAALQGAAPVSPRARAASAAQGVDLRGVSGRGPEGRVLEADVIALAANGLGGQSAGAGEQKAAAGGAPPLNASEGAEYTDEAFTKIRTVIAKSMMGSLSRSAQLTHHHSFDATGVLAMREDFKTCDESLGYGKVSVGDIILYVASRALARHPEINALVAEEGVRKYHTVNLGVAVDTPRGLMVPTVFGADKKSLREISAEVRILAAAAREGRISPDKLAGGTFTVSNLGATGVEMFTPIINPPQAAIAGICGVVERIRKGRNGRPEVYPSIGVSLTYDHRAVDGAPASRFAQELCAELSAFSWRTIAVEAERRNR